MELILTCVVIVVVALILIWLVDMFLPVVSYPARLIIGCVALFMLVKKLWPLLSGHIK